MKIFFDENFSPYLAAGLARFQDGRKDENIEVLHVVDKFGKGAADEVWIREIAQMHGAVVTQDFDIRRTKSLRELCAAFKLGMFFFRPPKKTSYRYWEWIRWVVRQWCDMTNRARTTEPPYAFVITPRSKGPEPFE